MYGIIFQGPEIIVFLPVIFKCSPCNLCSSNNILVNKVVRKLRDSKNVGGDMGTELRPPFLSTETVDCGLMFFLLNIAVMEKLCSCKLCMLF